MLNSFSFYLKLTLLCFRLIWHLAIFLASLLLKKIGQKRYIQVCLVVLVCLVWILNAQLVYKKNQPKINLEKSNFTSHLEEIDRPKKSVVFEEKNLRKEIINYEEIEKMGIKNLGLFLNLAQLYEMTGETELATKYLDKALQIEPRN